MKLGAFLLVLGVGACGGTKNESPAPLQASAHSEAVVKPARDDTAPNSVRRSKVRATVARGLGAFLGDVTLDERPVFLAGKFRGFRIVELRGPLKASSLLPGDVVTRINGMPIERPEQALEVFRSLEVASEIRVEFDRNGEPKNARFSIVEDESALGDAGAGP